MSSNMPAAARARRERRILVFNPGHVSDDVMVYGDFYHFPARGIGQCTCARHAEPVDGKPNNIGIHAKYDWPKDDRGRLLTESGRIEQVMPADDVADAIVSEDIRGLKGFVKLEGTAEEVEQQRADAIARYNEFHMEGVEERIANWERHVANYRLERPGARTPIMPKSLRKDYGFRQEFIELSHVGASQNEFLCETCGMDFEHEFGADANTCLEAHIDLHHPASTQVLGGKSAPVYAVPQPLPPNPASVAPRPSAVAPRPRPVPAPAPPAEEEDEAQGDLSETEDGRLLAGASSAVPGRPDLDEPDPDPELAAARRTRDDDDDAPAVPAAIAVRDQRLRGRELRIRAEKAGLDLSVGDKKGLDHGDPDVIADTKERLQKVKAKK